MRDIWKYPLLGMFVIMGENYKNLYEQMRKMVEKYQDDIVPGLRRDIDRLEAERQWISVNDRLPEPSTYVLVLTAPGTLSIGQNFVVADYIHAKQEKHGMFIEAYSGYSDDNILNVTHWMPLPSTEELK